MIEEKKSMTPHGLMFHHFHNDAHPEGQGSISAETFDEMLNFISKRFVILTAEEWIDRSLSGLLQKNHVCLTFDDNLLCQYEVALPVLKARGLTAFWFIYSSPLVGQIERVELYRYFRTVSFESVNKFYDSFAVSLDQSPYGTLVRETLKTVDINTHLADYPFYTTSDRWFRYVRDLILGPERYHDLMDRMISASNLDPETVPNRLWMNRSHLGDLVNRGHIIGLHSHTHPTRIKDMTATDQQSEYADNLNILQEIAIEPIKTMAHPCGSWSEETLEILEKMGIQIGFHSAMTVPRHHHLLFPRQDHAILLKQMQKVA
ncbi:MAG: polysaccharide deacetylase family protein [Magnetococcales bacterium]|nr:polysaccharide deacetylase family protein [Magnetococcales bacterium]